MIIEEKWAIHIFKKFIKFFKYKKDQKNISSHLIIRNLKSS